MARTADNGPREREQTFIQAVDRGLVEVVGKLSKGTPDILPTGLRKGQSFGQVFRILLQELRDELRAHRGCCGFEHIAHTGGLEYLEELAEADSLERGLQRGVCQTGQIRRRGVGPLFRSGQVVTAGYLRAHEGRPRYGRADSRDANGRQYGGRCSYEVFRVLLHHVVGREKRSGAAPLLLLVEALHVGERILRDAPNHPSEAAVPVGAVRNFGRGGIKEGLQGAHDEPAQVVFELLR